MRTAILQPGYLPWLGFFEQMWKSDIFVIYDNVQYTVRDWRNRNRIKTNGGIKYLTVPVGRVPCGTKINEVKIKYNTDWQTKHINSLKENYGQAPFFGRYFEPLREIISKRFECLVELDVALIKEFNRMLGLDRKIILSSGLGIVSDGRCQRLIEICKQVGADTFYEGAAGKNYIDIGEFERCGIKVDFQNYRHPIYKQPHGEFVPYLSIIDLLFNEGPGSLEILIEGGS